MKKLTVILLFGVLFAFKIQAQGDWKQIYSQDGISVFSKEEECKNSLGRMEHTHLLKVENNTSGPKLVEWDLQMTDNKGKCTGCSENISEHHRAVKVSANGALEGECNAKSRLSIMKVSMRYTDMTMNTSIYYTEVKVVNIKVSNAN